MLAKVAHDLSVQVMTGMNLTQKVLLDIETMAGQGKFATVFSTDVEYTFVCDVQKCLVELGYKVTLTQDNGLNKMYINW